MKTPKMITIEPCAGLGNRLRALCSMRKLAQKYQWKFNVVWKREEACYARFATLFALSRCKKIIGSYGSSFSECAAMIGGREYVVAKNII